MEELLSHQATTLLIIMRKYSKFLTKQIFLGEPGDRRVPTIIFKFQVTKEHWLLRIPNLSAQYTHCYALVGVFLDQPRSHVSESCFRYFLIILYSYNE